MKLQLESEKGHVQKGNKALSVSILSLSQKQSFTFQLLFLKNDNSSSSQISAIDRRGCIFLITHEHVRNYFYLFHYALLVSLIKNYFFCAFVWFIFGYFNHYVERKKNMLSYSVSYSISTSCAYTSLFVVYYSFIYQLHSLCNAYPQLQPSFFSIRFYTGFFPQVQHLPPLLPQRVQ